MIVLITFALVIVALALLPAAIRTLGWIILAAFVLWLIAQTHAAPNPHITPTAQEMLP